jgi:hypothetical protein
MFRFCPLRFRDLLELLPIVDLIVSLPYPCVCVFYRIHTLCLFCFFPDVCKDNVYFTDRFGSICSNYQGTNCSHEIMSEDDYAGVVENCPWSCGLCEGRSFYNTWIDLDTNPPVHIVQSIMSNSYVEPPVFLLCGPFASRFVAYQHVYTYLPLLTSRMFLRHLSSCRLADGWESSSLFPKALCGRNDGLLVFGFGATR